MCFFRLLRFHGAKVVTVVILQSCGIQFYVLLRMAITPDKKDKAYTKTKAYTNKSLHKGLHKTKAYTKQKPRQKQNHCGARRGGGSRKV